MASKTSGAVLLLLLVLLAAVALAPAASVAGEQRSDADLSEPDATGEERQGPGAVERVKGFFGELSVAVRDGVQDGVGRVTEGVKKGTAKAKEYASTVRDYLRDKLSGEAEPPTTDATPAPPVTQ